MVSQPEPKEEGSTELVLEQDQEHKVVLAEPDLRQLIQIKDLLDKVAVVTTMVSCTTLGRLGRTDVVISALAQTVFEDNTTVLNYAYNIVVSPKAVYCRNLLASAALSQYAVAIPEPEVVPEDL